MRTGVNGDRRGRLRGRSGRWIAALLTAVFATVSIAPAAISAHPAAAAAPIATEAAAWQPSVAASTSTTIVGYGKRTVGGLNGQRLVVTSLADRGTGTLRDALGKARASRGPDTITFAVAGTITLQSDLRINFPFLTIDGGTAPAQGVQIKGGMIMVAAPAHDIIFRHLKVRPGDMRNQSIPDERDAISLNGQGGRVYNVVIDHCTLIWGPDIGGLAVLAGVSDVTVQHSIIGEGLYLSTHPEAVAAQGGHSYALNISQLSDSPNVWPRRITLYGNLLTSSDTRMPQVMGGEQVEIVNNVIYNWGGRAAYGNPRSLSLVGNVFKPGPQSTRGVAAWEARTNPENPQLRSGVVYEAGNTVAAGMTMRGGPSEIYARQPFGLSLTPQRAANAYSDVLAQVGATRPVRDSVDRRIVANVQNGTMVHPNGRQPGRYLNGSDLIWPNLGSR